MIDIPKLHYYLNKLLPNHKEGAQEDSAEILLLLLNYLRNINQDKIEKELLIQNKKSFTCGICNTNAGEVNEQHLMITCPIPLNDKIYSIKELTELFLRSQWNTVRRYCPTCKFHTNQSFIGSFLCLKRYVIIHLNRFYVNNGNTGKIKTNVSIEKTIMFNGRCYIFYGSINHTGEMNSGHYYNYILNEGKYYYISDMVHKEVIMPEVSNSPYILIYKLVEYNIEN